MHIIFMPPTKLQILLFWKMRRKEENLPALPTKDHLGGCYVNEEREK